MGCTGSGGEVSLAARSAELDGLLREIVEVAQRAWATFRVPVDQFLRHLSERLPDKQLRTDTLRRLHTTDLYLACACARGDLQAFTAFEDRCLVPLGGVLGKLGITSDLAAEVIQHIRVSVLVGDGRPAEITRFAGRGDLRSWVRVMATRRALHEKTRARRRAAADDGEQLLARIAATETVERDPALPVYRRELKRAFELAMRASPNQERLVLRQHYVDGLSIDELGALYRVHRSTAARLLERARTRVFEATRAQLGTRLRVPERDIDSIIRLVRSQVEISLRALRRRRR